MIDRQRYSFLTLVLIGLTLMLSSWNDEERRAIIGPLPPVPDYTDSTQWFIVNRGGEADLFYIISTETGDHMQGDDTCHLADTYDETLRKNMLKEMVAVDSFYSGKRLNYFSPFYRQVSMNSWGTPDLAFARLPIAVEDVKRSWDYYLKHLNQGRPFIIAGFSQGAVATFDILKEMPDSVRSRLVAAYAIGFKVTQEDIVHPNIKLAQGATDTGVLIGFNSVKSPESILYISENNVACINPVNWHTDAEPATFVLYGRRGNDTLSVWCDTVSHHLIVDGYTKHRPIPLFGKPGNYHNMELKFYYPYIRQNMADRVAAFMKKKKEE